MASRLYPDYPTIRWLYRQVLRHLKGLGLGSAASPLVLGLMALYITGLLVPDRRQNGTRMANWLPARAPDSLNHLLRVHRVSTWGLMEALIQWAKPLGEGYLAVNDVVMSKPFSQRNCWVGWVYAGLPVQYMVFNTLYSLCCRLADQEGQSAGTDMGWRAPLQHHRLLPPPPPACGVAEQTVETEVAYSSATAGPLYRGLPAHVWHRAIGHDQKPSRESRAGDQ